MTNETKRDVFDDALAYAPVGREYDPVNDDEAGDLRSRLSARYAAALPDDLPVIPKAVGEYIKDNEDLDLLVALTFASKGYKHSELWIAMHQNVFSLAWVLGVWRVEESGEIVKLEAQHD